MTMVPPDLALGRTLQRRNVAVSRHCASPRFLAKLARYESDRYALYLRRDWDGSYPGGLKSELTVARTVLRRRLRDDRNHPRHHCRDQSGAGAVSERGH